MRLEVTLSDLPLGLRHRPSYHRLCDLCSLPALAAHSRRQASRDVRLVKTLFDPSPVLVLPMKTHLLTALLLVPLMASPVALAGDTTCTTNREGRTVCPAPDSTCLKDRYGDVICSTPGGGIETDRYGNPVCGPGYCTRDLRGDLFCSNSPRGASSTDRAGNAVCAGQCVPAKAQACVKPQPAR